jgi:hypothetical protein
MDSRLTAAIAAKYWASKVRATILGHVQDTDIEVSGELLSRLTYRQPSDTAIFQLILKPLSEISEADAIEVAKMCKRDYHKEFKITDLTHKLSDTAKEAYKILQITFKSTSVNLANHIEEHQHGINITTWGSINHYYDRELSPVNMAVQITDFLRSLSYDMDNLIRQKIAIEHE